MFVRITRAGFAAATILIIVFVTANMNGVAGEDNSPLSVDIHISDGYTLSNPRELTANYTYIVDAASTTPFQISLHVVQPFADVKLAGSIIIVKPNRPRTNQTSVDTLGNTVVTISFQSTSTPSKLVVTLLQQFTVYSISYSVDPSKVGKYDTSSQLYKTYTQSVEYIESDNSDIIAKAKEIAGGESNPYLIAAKIQSYVTQHMTYDMAAVTPWNPSTEGALYALKYGRGVCRHYAALFTALARANGIPTADIWGSWAGSNEAAGSVLDDGGKKHNWVQFYIPNYGWIPADPTAGESWFAKLSDNYHVPVMSVSYVYQRAWGTGTWQSAFSGEEPVITQGFQVPEFGGITVMISFMMIVAIITITRADRHGRRIRSTVHSLAS